MTFLSDRELTLVLSENERQSGEVDNGKERR